MNSKPVSLRRQFSINAAAEGYSQAATIGVQLLVLPVMLLVWGAEQYGGWLIISAFPTYMAMANFGFSQIAANDMTMRIARDDHPGAIIVYRTAWLMNLLVSALVVVLAAAFSLFFPIATLFNVSGGGAGDVAWAVFFLNCSVVVTFCSGVVGAAMRSVGRNWLMVATNASSRLLDALVLVGIAGLGGGFVLASACMLLAKAILLITVSATFFGKHREFVPSLDQADHVLLRKMIQPSFAYMTYNLGHAVSIQGGILVVAAFMGASSVVVLNAIRTLTRLGRMAASVVVYASEPIFAHLAGKKSRQRSQDAFRMLALSVGLGVLVYASGMLLMGEQFLFWWTHGLVVNETIVFRLMVLAVVFEIGWFTLQTPYVSTNRHGYFSYSFLMLSSASLVVLALTVSNFGLLAAGLVTAGLHALVLLVTIYRVSTTDAHSVPNESGSKHV